MHAVVQGEAGARRASARGSSGQGLVIQVGGNSARSEDDGNEDQPITGARALRADLRAAKEHEQEPQQSARLECTQDRLDTARTV